MNFKKLFFITKCFVLCLVVASCTSTPDRSPKKVSEDPVYLDGLESKLNYTPAQKRLIRTGRSLIGTPYVYGGTSPTNGLDCSAFTQYVYKKALGVNLPRTARQQSRIGKRIPRKYLLPGDLVFLNLSGNLSHVGIYIGDGKFFHASTSKNRLMVTSLNSSYFSSRYHSAVRP